MPLIIVLNVAMIIGKVVILSLKKGGEKSPLLPLSARAVPILDISPFKQVTVLKRFFSIHSLFQGWCKVLKTGAAR